ncbi:hypothetical protein CB0940_07838, partial [Cercospora beticola]
LRRDRRVKQFKLHLGKRRTQSASEDLDIGPTPLAATKPDYKRRFHPVTSTLFILSCGLTAFFAVSIATLKLSTFLRAYLTSEARI